jgi:hypothetical protein
MDASAGARIWIRNGVLAHNLVKISAPAGRVTPARSSTPRDCQFARDASNRTRCLTFFSSN